MPIETRTPARTTVRIPTASGDELEAWLYLPEGPGPHPAVVMAHGIGAIKAGGLAVGAGPGLSRRACARGPLGAGVPGSGLGAPLALSVSVCGRRRVRSFA